MMRLKEIIPLQKHKLPYERAIIELYIQDYTDEFVINDSLYEGVEKSFPRQDVIARLKQKFGVYVYPDAYDPINILFQLDVNRQVAVQQLFQFITQQGWFISLIQIGEDEFHGNDQHAIKILINAQYKQAVVTLEATHGMQPTTPKLLYHATLLQIWNTKIKQKGLSPKSKSTLSTHPERVYFTTTINSAMVSAQKLAQEKLILAKKEKYNPNRFNPEQYYKHWVVLEIDTSKIPHIRGLSYFRVHEDPNMPKEGKHAAFYSQNYVPPVAIKVVKQFDVY